MKKLVFFFPWPEVSGGPFYLSRLANEVAKRKIYDVYYTDYYPGLCESLLEDKTIKILRYNNEGNKFKIFPNEPIILIMAEYWAHMVPILNPHSQILFFNWHNECVPVLKRDWCATDRFINRFLALVKSTSAVFFCDKTHWLAQNRKDIIFDETYVPIIVPERKWIAQKNLVREDERNIAVMGRLCLDKIYAVLDLMDNIISLRDNIKTKVYVIGDGDQADLLFKRKYPSHIKLIKCGTMDIERALSLMCKKTDILFAMGTSVLEGASIHLPAVVIPNDIKPFQCNHYPYLYESEGYSLGWYPEQIEELGIVTHSLEEIFSEIYDLRRKNIIGERCFRYCIENHHDNINLFISAINKCGLTYEIYSKFVKRTLNVKNIAWHIKNALRKKYGYTKRKIALFGFPLYIHTKTNDIHHNIYICGIPFFRINEIGGAITIHILPAVWAGRLIQKTFESCIKVARKMIKRLIEGQ